VTDRHSKLARALTILLIAAALLWPVAAQAAPVDRWAAEIAQASARFGIPEQWIRRVIQAESGGETRLHGQPVVSRAGAMGLMQLMPGTWSDMRALLGLGHDPQDPRDNILAGTFYLRLLYDRFGYPGLFAAYNAGPSRYSAFLAGVWPLPPETLAYLRRASASASASASANAGARANMPARSGLFAALERPEAVRLPVPARAGSAAPAIRFLSPQAALFVPLTGEGTIASAQ
jgi:hypothetical protein